LQIVVHQEQDWTTDWLIYEQILMQLLENAYNAVKFTQNKNIKIETIFVPLENAFYSFDSH
jgi:C4-dicarboxylate-specific signal transduction histidine kinase